MRLSLEVDIPVAPHLVQMRLEAFMGAFLIGTHQARIANHIGGEDCGETAGRGHSCGIPPQSRRTA